MSILISFFILFSILSIRKFIDRLKGEQIMKAYVNEALANLRNYDEDTYGHSIRVCQKALSIGRNMNLSKQEMDGLEEAALLHDIGKMTIPMSILAKPSRLTDEEFAIMKTHADAGYHMAKELGCSDVVAEAIRDHHERFDGNGYAHRHDMGKLARIICIADSYDAMHAKRRYDAARAKADVLVEISNCAGKQFDPDIARVALKSL